MQSLTPQRGSEVRSLERCPVGDDDQVGQVPVASALDRLGAAPVVALEQSHDLVSHVIGEGVDAISRLRNAGDLDRE